MKFIVLALLLPVLVTSIYDHRPSPLFVAALNFRTALQQHLDNRDVNALAKYISDDFQFHGREASRNGDQHYVEGKKTFVERWESWPSFMFEGGMTVHYGPDGNILVSDHFGGLDNFTLSPNAALNAGYEMVKFKTSSISFKKDGGPIVIHN